MSPGDVADVTKNYLVAIPVDGGRIMVEELTAQPTLEQLRHGVGDGDIEVVPRFSKLFGRACVAFCNEDGKLKGLPINHPANVLWRLSAGPIDNDILVGPICVVIATPKFLRDL